MKIITEKMTREELRQMAGALFGDMVKAVVDVEKEIVAVDAELHADLEAFLIESGSIQKNLWGINFYPDLEGNNFVEFDSMINIRPSQNNRSRGVESEVLQKQILSLVSKRIGS